MQSSTNTGSKAGLDKADSKGTSVPITRITKCWVYVLVVDGDIAEQADEWVRTQNIRWFGEKGDKKEYRLIKSQAALAEYCKDNQEKVEPKGLLKNISKEDVLYVYCHGFVNNDHKPTGEIGGDTFITVQGKKTKTEARLTPQMFSDHLEKEELSFEHKKLKLFSCYSSEFVPKLSVVMAEKWPSLEVYGYTNETIPAGTKFRKIAGLTHEEGVQYRKGDKNIRLEERKGRFKAKKHRVSYKNGTRIELAVPVPTAETFTDKKQDTECEDISAGVSRLNINRP